MQKISDFKGYTVVTPTAQMAAETHGARAKCLQRLVRLKLPVPLTVALPFDTVARCADGHPPSTVEILSLFEARGLVSVRPSSQDSEWGGPSALLNVGMNGRIHAHISNSHGAEAANAIYMRFIQSYAVNVARLDPDVFQEVEPTEANVARALEIYEEEAEEPFPQNPARQLAEVLRSMARTWDSTSARLLRQARGAPADAGLGLVVQRMALGFGPRESGSGVVQFVDPKSGEAGVFGRYLRQSLFRDALRSPGEAHYLKLDARGPSLQSEKPEVFNELVAAGDICRERLREEMEIEFYAIDNCGLRDTCTSNIIVNKSAPVIDCTNVLRLQCGMPD
ncbi:MAG: pyruvate, phosphate dikinase, partial [Planctomycetota bacterium]